jgi:acetyltransferase-like isoleucine patch superfamily enzyme
LKKDLCISDPEIDKLYKNLILLHSELRDYTSKKYNRINPFYEDLFDWKERGIFLFGENKNITLYNSTTVVGNVEIGKNTWVGPFTTLDGSGGLKIGENCSISANVFIITHDTVKWALSGGVSPYEYAPVSIGNNTFIGIGSIILKGISIGSGCVVAAGSVVTKNVNDGEVVAGNPANVINTKIKL